MKFTECSQELQQGVDREVLLHSISNRIRQSLELEEILTATVAEIRSFLGTERVMVYRFHANGSGKVIAESVDERRLTSLLGLNFPADDIPPDARDRFVRIRQRSIVNVATQQIGESPLDCEETGKPLINREIKYRSADPCHIQYLTAMGVQFSLVVPILYGPQLWGLLVSHNSQPRTIANEDLQFVQQVADEVSIAISQSTLLTLAREQAQREASINRVAALLHTLPNLPFQAALEEAVAMLQGCGGRLYLTAQNKNSADELYTCGVQPAIGDLPQGNAIENHPFWQKWIQEYLKPTHPEVSTSGFGVPLAITDIYKETNLETFLPAFRERGIRSLLVLSLRYRQNFFGYLTIFRNEINAEIWWAGRFDSSQQQSQPRKSFEAWREIKIGQPREWNAQEIELLQALCYHFSMTIQQHQLYQQVQVFNANLEHQVKERTLELQHRTLELQQSLELARVLKQVTNQIRSTLDVSTILQTIVREVRSLLKTDRVIIYQFLESWHGKVVVEEVTDKNLSILGQVYHPNCFPVEYTYQYQAGKVRAIKNITEAGLSECHVEFLQTINVKANLVVPIRRSDYLWGLLVAHECNNTRNWLAAEIELLQQLADQAAIAIHQAELYEQTHIAATTATEKAQQLEQALDKLQHTQSQLIQTEKMSSLGQLVAGIAHEINNPVNFIYGNISHVSEYAQEILNLLELYQEDYPNPSSKIAKLMDAIDLGFLLEDLPKTIGSMKSGADRIRQLVLSLRNFSRLDEAETKLVDLHEGLDSTLLIVQHRLNPTANCKGIQVVKEYGELPLVQCCPGQLNQVFMNIINNAIDSLESRFANDALEEGCKYSVVGSREQSHPLPTIRIRTEVLDNGRVAVKIADNGTGMTEAVRRKLFDPFFTTKPVGKGTGLGLAISYQIVVEKHGGELKCNSSPGKGAEFAIVLPHTLCEENPHQTAKIKTCA